MNFGERYFSGLFVALIGQDASMDAVLAIFSGAFIGSVLGFVGAGGAMTSVPILLYIFHFTPTQATTAALAIVLLAALSGAIPKMRTHEVLYREAFSIWGIGLVTNIGGAALSKHLPNSAITTGFACILVFAGFATARGPVKVDAETRMTVGVLIITALGIGAMTGVFGVGGGFLAIPILVLFYNTPQNKAAGTSLLIISINSATSFLGHHAVGNPGWHRCGRDCRINGGISQHQTCTCGLAPSLIHLSVVRSRYLHFGEDMGLPLIG